MTINERMILLRKACRKNQNDFAEVLGLSRTALAEIEAGRNKVLDRHLTMLSNWKEYNINIEWLRTGQGEMFLETETGLLEKLRSDFGLNEMQFSFVSEFLRLSDSEKEIILAFMRKVASHGHVVPPADQDDIEERVAEYRRQLELEKGAGGKSSASSDAGEKRA